MVERNDKCINNCIIAPIKVKMDKLYFIFSLAYIHDIYKIYYLCKHQDHIHFSGRPTSLVI